MWVAPPESGGLEQSEIETSWQRDSQREGGQMDSIEILPLL